MPWDCSWVSVAPLTQIRTGERSAFIEGIFEVAEEKEQRSAGNSGSNPGLKRMLKSFMIRREISAAGIEPHIIKIGNVTLSTPEQIIAAAVVEIYGQGEQRTATFDTIPVVSFLDSFGGLRRACVDRSDRGFCHRKNSFRGL